MERRISVLIIFSLIVLTVNFGVFLLALNYTPYDDSFENSKSLNIGNSNSKLLINSDEESIQNSEDLSYGDSLSHDSYSKETSRRSKSSGLRSNRKIVVEEGPVVIEEKVKEATEINEKYITDYVDKGYGDVFDSNSKQSNTFVQLTYDRFDVFIEQNYYNSNQADLDGFFNDFETRFDMLESMTNWNSETSFGNKLRINVTDIGNAFACSGGQFFPMVGNSYVDLRLANPLYESSTNRTCLWEGHMEVLVHEATHGITPKYISFDPVGPAFGGWWLREGWAEYYEYNLLSLYGDISQATADDEIYKGTSFYNWDGFDFGGVGYITNDYHDTSPGNNEIQASQGYAITAWMFSLLRDDYNLDWSKFYQLFESNEESLEEAWSRFSNPYFIDTVILELFTRSSNADFTTFQYDGPSGPGWGVRNIEAIDWYADLIPILDFDDTLTYKIGDRVDLNVTVENIGDTDANNVSVRFYRKPFLASIGRYDEFDTKPNSDPSVYTGLFHEEVVDIGANANVVLNTNFVLDLEENFTFFVRVDEEDVKIELNEGNNEDFKELIIEPLTCVNHYNKYSKTWEEVCS